MPIHQLLILISIYWGIQLQRRIQSSVKRHLLGFQRHGLSTAYVCIPCTHSNTCINKCKNARQYYRPVCVAGHVRTQKKNQPVMSLSLACSSSLLHKQQCPHRSPGNLLSLLHVLIVPHMELYATLRINSSNNCSLWELLLSPPPHPVASKGREAEGGHFWHPYPPAQGYMYMAQSKGSHPELH